MLLETVVSAVCAVCSPERAEDRIGSTDTAYLRPARRAERAGKICRRVEQVAGGRRLKSLK
jgi:hypothetical protein